MDQSLLTDKPCSGPCYSFVALGDTDGVMGPFGVNQLYMNTTPGITNISALSVNTEKDTLSAHLALAPLSVCWDITSRCNDDCAFCFRVLSQPDLSLEQHLTILAKLVSAGVKMVSFIGGEPLLVDHLPILLEETHRAGIITSVITNGILLKRKWNSLAGNVDRVTLPIDGSSEHIQSQMTRRKGHLELVCSLIEMLKRSNTRIIKINTVVSRRNLSDLHNIARLVSKLEVQHWKIFHFMPIRGYAAQNVQQFSITDYEFRSAVDHALSHCEDLSRCRVTIADRDRMEKNYFSISPDGDVRVTVNGQDEIVGSLLHQDLTEIWRSPLFDHAKHARFRSWLSDL